jgi:hypothetical protein
LACEKCNGDFVVGEGGRLECGRCGHIVGDISLLLGQKPFEGASHSQQLTPKALEGHTGKLHPDICELAQL